MHTKFAILGLVGAFALTTPTFAAAPPTTSISNTTNLATLLSNPQVSTFLQSLPSLTANPDQTVSHTYVVDGTKFVYSMTDSTNSTNSGSSSNSVASPATSYERTGTTSLTIGFAGTLSYSVTFSYNPSADTVTPLSWGWGWSPASSTYDSTYADQTFLDDFPTSGDPSSWNFLSDATLESPIYGNLGEYLADVAVSSNGSVLGSLNEE